MDDPKNRESAWQVDDILKEADGVSSEYQVMIDHLNGRDIMTLFVEGEKGIDKAKVESELKYLFKARIGIAIAAQVVEIGDLPRSEKKSTRIFDNRY